MHASKLAHFTTLGLLILVAVAPVAAQVGSNSQAELLAAMNTQRGRFASPPLVTHPTLQAAAQGHAEWMAATRTLSHTGAGRSSFVQRIHAAGTYPKSELAENIAMGASVQQCVGMWMRSSGHSQNMLSRSYKTTGCGVAVASNGSIYICAVFGSAAVPAEVTAAELERFTAKQRADLKSMGLRVKGNQTLLSYLHSQVDSYANQLPPKP